MAMTLACELGVFDDDINPAESLRVNQQPVPSVTLKSWKLRKACLKDVLLIFSMQLSGRLNLTSFLPLGPGFQALTKTPTEIYRECAARRKHLQDSQKQSMGVPSTDSSDQMILSLWMEMASILDVANRELVPNRSAPRDFIKTGRYVGILKTESEKLRSWRKALDECYGSKYSSTSTVMPANVMQCRKTCDRSSSSSMSTIGFT